ncbi:MAG TPA: TetR/AcrR family transcriptional regulator [Phenylobacterium sp.]|nr:TetR/AcrR family transcriptional regulator [Phenylobacterium sp.]
MRYTAEHKERTRSRILREASTSLRRGGPDGVVVADIMAGAGLTHGGFYVHFKSKDDLIVNAIADAVSEVNDRFDAIVDGRTPASSLAAYIDAYLSQQHREHRDHGCPIAALAGDVPRLSDEAREAFQTGTATIARRIAVWLEALGKDNPDELAGSVLAELVGALVLARAMADPRESRRILKTSRAALRSRLGID